MKRFPAYINLQDRPVVIIGGGETGLRKARLALAAGAEVKVIWPEIAKGTREELQDAASFVSREPVEADLEDAALVFVALDDADTAERWAQIARKAGALINVVDQPALCDFTTPSIIDRGRLTVAISTDGAGPVFGRALRAKIEAMLPRRAGALLEFAQSYRDAVKGKVAGDDRRTFWEAFFDGPIAAQVLAGDERGAHEAMLATLNSEAGAERSGIVHIVGAGPGDPELLTLKAFRLIQSADVILYDRLVSEEILALARRDAERRYVGKAKAEHAMPQEDIEAHMIALARDGKIVVRLKGGDPFVFGRGGEELEAVRAAGIPVYVTPGITAATGCAASAGLALTHRDHAQAVTFVTGHAKGDADPALDWAALAALKNTLVVYMGVGKAAAIANNLISNGRAGATPVAVIENGTRENEIIVKGTLVELPMLIAAGGVKGPALLVIGEVAALADGATLQSLIKQERLVA
ncbi:MAG: siroheme synthase CysG [Pseudomonadota bacterium]